MLTELASICLKVNVWSFRVFKMSIDRFARLKSIYPYDYVQIQFDLEFDQYERAHQRFLEVLDDLDHQEDELTTYYAGNIGGVCEANEDVWHYLALTGKSLIYCGSYLQLFRQGHFYTIRMILGAFRETTASRFIFRGTVNENYDQWTTWKCQV